jgi:hypothetical protein
MCSRAACQRARPRAPAVHSPPNRFVPRPRYEYKPPSVFADYKYLAIAFVLIIIAVSVYLIRAPHKPLKIDPPPPPPVYIEPIPQRPAGN